MKKLLKVLPFFLLLIFMFFSAKQTYADSAPIVPVGNNFLQLQTKIDEASGTTQIQLTSDIELHQTIEIVAGKDIILDLNGHTVSSSSQYTTSAEFYVASGAKMTLIDSSTEKTGLIVQTTRPQAVWVNGEFVMNGGCISGSDNYNAQVIHLAGDNAKFTMNGGTITGNKKAKKAIFFAGGGSTFIMNGGVIKEFIGDDGCVVKSTDSSVQVKLLGGEIKDNISPHGCVYVMTESGNFVIGNGMEIWDNYNPEKTTNANVLINGIYKVKVENPSADMMFGVSFIGKPALGTITADADFLTSDTDKSAIPLGAIFADDPKFYFDSTTGKYTSKTPLVEGEVDFLCYANLKCVVASAPIAYANKSKTYKWQISSDEGNTWTDVPEVTGNQYEYAPEQAGSLLRVFVSVEGYIGTLISNVKQIPLSSAPTDYSAYLSESTDGVSLYVHLRDTTSGENVGLSGCTITWSSDKGTTGVSNEYIIAVADRGSYIYCTITKDSKEYKSDSCYVKKLTRTNDEPVFFQKDSHSVTASNIFTGYEYLLMPKGIVPTEADWNNKVVSTDSSDLTFSGLTPNTGYNLYYRYSGDAEYEGFEQTVALKEFKTSPIASYEILFKDSENKEITNRFTSSTTGKLDDFPELVKGDTVISVWYTDADCTIEASLDTVYEHNTSLYGKYVHKHESYLTQVEAKNATCTDDGNKAYFECSCGKWFEDSEAAKEITNHDDVVIKAAHTWNSDYTVDKEATCTEEGSKSIHCSKCAEKKNVTSIEKKAHVDGNKDGKCDACGDDMSGGLGGDPNPTPGPGGDPDPKPGPGGDPNPTPGPGGDPDPTPGPGGDPDPKPGPGGDPDPKPGPGGDPDPTPGPDGDPAPIPEADYLDELRDLLNAANAGDIVKWNKGTALPLDIMKLIVKKDVTLEFSYTYQNQAYVVVIDKDNVPTEEVPWYGPLYLASLTKTSKSLNGYVIKPGDTLNGIAKKFNTTVAELLKKNPTIVNPNLIYAGRRMEY